MSAIPIDGGMILNLAVLLAVLGFFWKLSRDVASAEIRLQQRIDQKIDQLEQRIDQLEQKVDQAIMSMSHLSERIARIEGRMEGPFWMQGRYYATEEGPEPTGVS